MDLGAYLRINASESDLLCFAIEIVLGEVSNEPSREVLSDFYRRAQINSDEFREFYFGWQHISEQLARLSDNRARLEFLLNLKSEFDLLDETAQKKINESADFSRRYAAEIERIEKLFMLEKSGNKEHDEKTKNLELTAMQQVLAIRYFLKFIRVESDKTLIARFLAVLNGGKNYDDIYKKVRDLNLHFINGGDDARFCRQFI